MKRLVTGILSGFLLICVFAGNMVYSIFQNRQLAVNASVGQPAQTVDLPVLMYHHILKDRNRWNDYVISPDLFEQDLQYLKANGYTAISIAELMDFLKEQTPLPEKPILITFDDGYESMYEYAFPLLQKYQMKAVISIIGKYTDLYSGNVTKSVSYSHVNWDQLRQMQESGLVEIGNHTYDMHHNDGGRKGIRKLESETISQYRKKLSEDIGALNQEIAKELGKSTEIFAYPFGSFSQDSEMILKELGFKVILTCEEKVNHLSSGDYTSSELLKLKRFNRPSGISSEKFFQKFQQPQ